MKKIYNQLHIRLIFLSYLYAIIVFSLFRLMLFLLEFHNLSAGQNSPEFATILRAFIMGIRFDLAISGYIMFLPFLILTTLEFFNRPVIKIKMLAFYIILVGFSFAFIVCAADIPYFSQFYSRFSVAAFQWVDSPVFVLQMIFAEPRYWLSIIPLVIIVFGFYKILKKTFIKESSTKENRTHFVVKIASFLIMTLLIFIGVRGRIVSKSPIRVGTAYFSENSFLNQLGLNPNFTLIRSFVSSKQPKAKTIQLIDNELAIKNVQQYLNLNTSLPESAIARLRNTDSITKNNYNIVLIIMESMSAGKMGRYGNTYNLTPFLDSLANKAYTFDNIYTAGMHTYNGIYSTLFSYPAIYLQHPMIDVKMLRYNGISNVLRKHNYSSVYFTTHDGQFDNTEGFLINNDFDKIITEASYPPDITTTALGVPDDYMFKFSLPILDELSADNNRFFAAFMTASDHGPYYVPPYFTPKLSSLKDQIVEYADWSLQEFIKNATKHDWFDSTIFVFIADHGAPLNPVYEMPLNYFHSPLIMYAPGLLKPEVHDCIGGQIDVFPTLMGILNLPYTNNTFGIDLLSEKRPFIYFNGDDKLGVINKEFLLISKQDGSESLFKYVLKDRTNYIEEYKDTADSMRNYANSNLQAAQYIMNTNQQYIP